MTIFPVQSITSASASIPTSTPAIRSSSMRTSPVGKSPISGSMERTVPPLRSTLPMLVPPWLDERSVRGQLPYGCRELVDGGNDLVLERVRKRKRHALGGNAPNRCVERLEAFV